MKMGIWIGFGNQCEIYYHPHDKWYRYTLLRIANNGCDMRFKFMDDDSIIKLLGVDLV